MASRPPIGTSFASIISAGLRACDAATTTHAKGKALEDLIANLFEQVPGIEHVQRNILNCFDTEEIDLAIGNAGVQHGLAAFPDVLLVECKNWSKAVGSQEVAYFIARVQQRGCSCGILVAMNGVTGDATDLTNSRFQIASALKDQVRILVIKREDIEKLNTPDDFVCLLRRKVLELVATGSAI